MILIGKIYMEIVVKMGVSICMEDRVGRNLLIVEVDG